MRDDQLGPGTEPEPETSQPQDTSLSQPNTGETAPPSPETGTPPEAPSDSRLADTAGASAQPVPQQAEAPSGNWWEQPAPVGPANATAPPAQQQPTAPQEIVHEADDAREGTSFWRWLWEGAVLVVLAFVIAFVIKVFIVQPFYIPSGSMEPTLLPGDRVLVNKFIYRFRDPQPGDIVVFAAPRDAQQRDFIKRVIAVEGQTVEVKDGKLYVNGKANNEVYVKSDTPSSDYGPLTVSDNSVFVMGDNRSNSSDSRVFGPFNRNRILGEAFVVYWPVTRVRTL